MTTPYLVLSVMVLLFAIGLLRVRFPPSNVDAPQASAFRRDAMGNLLHVPHFVWAVITQFFYVGAQVGTWSFLIQYVEEYTHQPEKVAGYCLSGTLLLFALGRFVSTYLMQYIRPNVLMGVLALANVALLSVAIVRPGWVGLWALMSTSFCMSLMYPTIFALGLKGLEPNTTLGASVLVMAIIGGAAITPLLGWVAERAHSMATGFSIPLGCYLVVAYFSFIGCKARLLASEVLPADQRHQGSV